MNKVIVIGRLVKDPDLSFTPGKGTAVCKITVAVDRNRKNANGEREADFINVTIWNKAAENTANYMSKGKLIGISGSIRTGSYDAKDGSKRYTFEVMADEVQFLERVNQGQASAPATYVDEMTPVDDGMGIPF